MSIQLFVPTFHVEECLEEIRECLEKGWTGIGFKTVELEEAWKNYTGLPYAHFINSNTSGLNLAFEILKMEGKWDSDTEVITTPLTFVATNHAILRNGLKPVFADVDESLCLDPDDIKKKLTPKTKAIIFVGMGGNIGRYYDVVKICQEHNLKLVLDAAHMAGTRYNGKIPGTEADVIIYSFDAIKNIPTGDSGMICFREEKHDQLVRKLSWLGINKDVYSRMMSKETYKWLYDVEYVGNKYNGNSIMASLALVGLRYVEQNNAYRRQISEWYDQAFKNNPKVQLVKQTPGLESARHLYQIVVENRDQMLLYLNSLDIYPGVHYRDNTFYSMYKYAHGTCPRAHEYSEKLLSLPLHLLLTHEQVLEVASAINAFPPQNN